VLLHGLPQSLTCLSLEWATASSGSWDGISSSCQLPELQELTLYCTDVLPATLLPMTQLSSLSWCPASEVLVDNALFVLEQMQQLSSLHLQSMEGESAAEHYAALTASSHLAELSLVMCSMAPTAAQHMFQAGRLLPHLHTISVCGMPYDMWNEEAAEIHGLNIGPGLDAARLAACCPALQSLGTVVLEEDVCAADLLPLLQLTALTYLSTGGAACDDVVAEHVLAKMTGGGCCSVACKFCCD
jgi:hypothetical protein